MHDNFVIIVNSEAHLATGRVQALDTAMSVSGLTRDGMNDVDRKDFGRFIETTHPRKLTVYGPTRTAIIYPVAKVN